jgi:hypothetical protein
VCRTDPTLVYPSAAEAARVMGVARNAVRVSIGQGSACCEKYWRFEDVPEEQCPTIKPKVSRQPVVFKGKSYPSIYAAATTVKIPGLSLHAKWMRVFRHCERTYA